MPLRQWLLFECPQQDDARPQWWHNSHSPPCIGGSRPEQRKPGRSRWSGWRTRWTGIRTSSRNGSPTATDRHTNTGCGRKRDLASGFLYCAAIQLYIIFIRITRSESNKATQSKYTTNCLGEHVATASVTDKKLELLRFESSHHMQFTEPHKTDQWSHIND